MESWDEGYKAGYQSGRVLGMGGLLTLVAMICLTVIICVYLSN